MNFYQFIKQQYDYNSKGAFCNCNKCPFLPVYIII